MSSLGNLIGGLGASGSYSLNAQTKSGPVQSSLNNLISNYNTTAASDSTALQGGLSGFINQYLSQGPQATRYAGQEQSAIDRFYNGDVEKQLASIRGATGQASSEAVQRALDYNRANLNRSVMGGGGAGDSSYLNRVGIGTAADLYNRNLLGQLGQERTDVGYTNQMPLSLIGQRTGIGDTLAQRSLVPATTSMGLNQQNLGWDANTLAALAGINNQNNMYGVQYKPSFMERAGSLINNAWPVLQDAGSAASGYMTGGIPGAVQGAGMGGWGSLMSMLRSRGGYSPGLSAAASAPAGMGPADM